MCNINVQDILLCTDAAGGYSDGIVKTLHFIDAAQVVTIPEATDYVISGDLVLAADTRTAAQITAGDPADPVPAVFSRIQLRKEGLQYAGEPEGDEEDGNIVHGINGRLPKMSAAKNAILDSMRGGVELICIFTDRNGKTWIMGDANEGCTFQAVPTTDGNGYNITAPWTKGRMLYEYTGAVVTLA